MKHATTFRAAAARALPALAAALALLAAAPAGAIDWSAVPEREVMLLYPGQASWEWVLTPSDHSGARKFREGKNCRGCHDGEQEDIGARIASGKKLEQAPIPGKPGSLALKVQTAHDGERLYVRLQWQGAPATGKKMDPEVAARATVMLDDGNVKEAARAGCWGSCHDDAIGMASAPATGKITKYLVASRTRVTRKGGGENFRPDDALAQLRQDGAFLEYWQARLNPGQPGRAVDGYILDKRHENAEPAVRAEATGKGGAWTVVLSRPLKAGAGYKELVPGKTYNVGFAVHDDYADHRFHYVSLEYTLTLDGGQADFVAARQ
jgi:cytochrome c-type protein NapC